MPETFDPTLRLSPSFMDGVFLSAAAIPDAALLYIGSTCIQEHFHHSLMMADWGQDLVREGRPSRLVLTFSDKTVAPMGVGHQVDLVVRRLLPSWRPSLLLLAELSRVTLAGEDLGVLADSVAAENGLPVIAATSRLLVRDWQTAFQGLLSGLADHLPEEAFANGPIPGTAAVIGLLFERNEEDHLGNVREVRRLVQMAGLEPLSIWLSREPWGALQRAARASVIVALPQGREAAQLIARRSGAVVLEADLPIGLSGCEAFLNRLAEVSGRREETRRAFQEALRPVVPLLDRAVIRRLAGRRVAIAALPDWIDGLTRAFREDFGLEVALTQNRCRLPDPGKEWTGGSSDSQRDHDPSVRSWNACLSRELERGPLDLIVGSSWERNALEGAARRIPFLEFGFPCLRWHDLVGLPGLGIRGVVAWAHRLSEALGGSLLLSEDEAW